MPATTRLRLVVVLVLTLVSALSGRSSPNMRVLLSSGLSLQSKCDTYPLMPPARCTTAKCFKTEGFAGDDCRKCVGSYPLMPQAACSTPRTCNFVGAPCKKCSEYKLMPMSTCLPSDNYTPPTTAPPATAPVPTAPPATAPVPTAPPATAPVPPAPTPSKTTPTKAPTATKTTIAPGATDGGQNNGGQNNGGQNNGGTNKGGEDKHDKFKHNDKSKNNGNYNSDGTDGATSANAKSSGVAGKSSGLSGGAIAGIIVGCIAALILAGFLLWKMKKDKSREEQMFTESHDVEDANQTGYAAM